MTMTHIETIELGSSAASITFSSIPQDYTDLVVVAAIRSDDNAGNNYAILGMGFNSITSGYSGVLLEGNGSSAGSFSRTTVSAAGTTLARICKVPNNGATANTFGNLSIYISNYSATQAHSYSVDDVTEDNSSTAYQNLLAGLCTNTAAITSLTFGTNNFGEQDIKTGSTISLYGIS